MSKWCQLIRSGSCLVANKYSNITARLRCINHQIRFFARKSRHSRTILPPPKFEKRLDCVILGVPNVGKSVLLNAMVKEKLAATCRKRHTTRGEILGVFNYRNTQLVFYDTPGYVGKSDAMRIELKNMREVVTNTVEKADVVLLVVDAARRFNDRAQFIFSEMVKVAIHHARKEVILVLNKVDLVEPKSRLLDLTNNMVSLINGIKLGPEKAHLAELDTTTFMISALHNDGVLDLKNYLIRIADIKPWLLSNEEGMTTLSAEERVEEIVLEQLLDNTHEEVPYTAKITCISITDDPLKPIKKILVDIIVETTGQARIVVGRHGRTLVKIRQSAAKALETIFPNKTVLVFLNIKVKK